MSENSKMASRRYYISSTTSSRLSSFKGYLAQRDPRPFISVSSAASPSPSTSLTPDRASQISPSAMDSAAQQQPQQRQSWRSWAGQMLKTVRGGGQPVNPALLGVDSITLFPGWAARKDRIGSTEAFDVEFYVSGFASNQRPPELASRSQRAFMRLAKGFAALPKLAADATDAAVAFTTGSEPGSGHPPNTPPPIKLTPSTENLLAQVHLPPRPTEITDEFDLQALERQFQLANANDRLPEEMDGSVGGGGGYDSDSSGGTAGDSGRGYGEDRYAYESRQQGLVEGMPRAMVNAALDRGGDSGPPFSSYAATSSSSFVGPTSVSTPTPTSTSATSSSSSSSSSSRSPSTSSPQSTSRRGVDGAGAGVGGGSEKRSTTGTEQLTADLRKLHANLESRLQPFWSTALSGRTVRVYLLAAAHYDESSTSPSSPSPSGGAGVYEGEKSQSETVIPIAVQDVVTTADGSFSALFKVSWESMGRHPMGKVILQRVRAAGKEMDMVVKAELVPEPSAVAGVNEFDGGISGGGGAGSGAGHGAIRERKEGDNGTSYGGYSHYKSRFKASVSGNGGGSAGGSNLRSPTNGAGHPAVHRSPIEQLQPRNLTPISPLPSSPSSSSSSLLPPPAAAAAATLLIPLTQCPIRVISDIDDTVKRSNILSGARAVFYNVFVRELKECVIPGMGEWYGEMWNRGVRFHYVSNGPFELLPIINEFLKISKLPSGSVKLKSYAGRSLFNGLLSDAGARKRAGVVEILTAFPESRFFLIGDSGEGDLELYAELAAERPNQIIAILIRDVGLPNEEVDQLADPTGSRTLNNTGGNYLTDGRVSPTSMGVGENGLSGNGGRRATGSSLSSSSSPSPPSSSAVGGLPMATPISTSVSARRTFSDLIKAGVVGSAASLLGSSKASGGTGGAGDAYFTEGKMSTEPEGMAYTVAPPPAYTESWDVGAAGYYGAEPQRDVQQQRQRRDQQEQMLLTPTPSRPTLAFTSPSFQHSTSGIGNGNYFAAQSEGYTTLQPQPPPLMVMTPSSRFGGRRTPSPTPSSASVSSATATKMTESEKKRWELQCRVWRARGVVPKHVGLRVFKEPRECKEEVAIVMDGWDWGSGEV